MQSASSKSSSKHQQKVQQIENDDQPSFKPVADLQAAGINVSPSELVRSLRLLMNLIC